MKQHHYHRIFQFSQLSQRFWLPLLLGLVGTVAIWGPWQVVVWERVAAIWILAFAVYLGQRSQHFARQTCKINQQLQEEIVHRQQVEVSLRESEERWQLALRGNNDGSWDWNVQESAAQYRNLVQHLNVGFVVHALDTHIVECNATACDLLGLSMDQMLGKAAIDPAWYFVREDGTRLPINEYPVNLVLSTGAPLSNYILGLNRGKRSQVWLLATAFPEFDLQQQLKQIVVTFIDITQLKQAETDRREMAEVMENAVSGIAKLDTHGRYVYVNKAYAEIVGYQPEEMIGMPWQQTAHPSRIEPLIAAYGQMKREGRVETEGKGVRKDGSIFYKELVMVAAYDKHHQFTGHYCFMKDISDRKQAEEALEKELLRSKTLFNTSIDGIVTMNDQGKVVHASPSFAAMLGYTLEETMSLNLADWDAQWTRAQLQEILKGSVVAPVFETRHRRKDGSIYHVEISYSRVKLDGEMMHFCICRDISERKRHEAERQRSEALLQSSQAQFKALVTNMPGVVYRYFPNTIDRPHHFTFVSSHASKLLELAPEVMTQDANAFVNLIHPADLPSFFESVSDAVEHFLAWHWEGRIITPSGQLKWIEGNSLAQRTAEGAAWDGLLIDISERKQTEIALQNSQARFAGILEIASDAIISINLEHQITLFNKGAESIFGYSAEDVVGQPLSLLLPDLICQAHYHYIQQYAGSPENARQMAQRGAIFGRRKDGTEFPAEASISKLNLNGEMIFTAFLRDITERNQAEALIRQNEEKFRMAIDFTYNWEYWQAPDGSFVYVSPSCERITGYAPAEFMQNSNLIQEIVHPDDVENFVQHHCRDESAIGFTDFRIITKTGEIRWIAHACQAVYNNAGAYVGKRVSNRDVSDRKRIEQEREIAQNALRKSEARFQAFMNHSPAASWITDANGLILYASETYLQTFQLPILDILGKTVFELFPAGIAQQFLENIQWVAETQTVLETMEFAPTPDGTMGDFLVYKFPIPDEAGQLLVGGVAIDITGRKRAEKELWHQKELLQTIIDHIPAMIALFDVDGHIGFINPELERVLGWTIEDWQQGHVLAECYPDPEYRQSVIDHMLAATGNWRDFTGLTATQQQLEMTWANVRLSTGQRVGIGQDISERKRKEVALRQAMEAAEAANLAKSTFLANMSHELRTPLNVILGFTQVMTHDASLTPSQQTDLQTIRHSGDHLLSLINNVLDLSKIEAGHSTVEANRFDLISLLHTLRTMMIERVKSKQLQLEFNIAPQVPQFVVADEQKLRQILLNLLSNAIKFTCKGRVTLWVGVLGQEEDPTCLPASIVLQFEVSDTGIGIADSEQETIFDAFIQAEAGKKSISGTGLGLTISRKLLELMQGEISVHSVPNVGSTFTFTVPVAPASSVEAPAESSDRLVIGLAPGQPQRRILVVDDQPENRLVLVRLLTHLGLEVQEASNGQEAIRIWQAWQPDLTWMDIRMPGLDGYEATRMIRDLEQSRTDNQVLTPHPPSHSAEPSIIIALTAQASQSDRALALAAGCNDYISKPFREETLFLKLKEYLGLNYLYAEPDRVLVNESPELEKSLLIALDPATLAQLSEDWLIAVEDAAVCGDDREIATLAMELPPTLALFRSQLTDYAEQFQFEQIVQLIRGAAP